MAAITQPNMALGALFLVLFSWSTPAITLPEETSLSYFVDSSGAAEVSDIAHLPPTRFHALPHNRVHLGFTSDDHWFRIALPALNGAEELVLSLSNARLGNVTLFTPAAGGGYTSKSAGVRVPFWSREIPSLVPAFLLDGASSNTVFLRVKNSGSMRFDLAIEPWKDFQKRSTTWLAFSLSAGAALCVVALYNACIYLHLRQSGYLWIAAFMLVCTIRQMTAAATANMFLWPDAAFWGKHAMTFTSLATLFVGVGMAHRIMHLRDDSPRWARLNWTVACIALAGGVLSTTGFQPSLFLMVASGLFIPISVATYALVALRRGSRSAGWFLVSWGAVLAASLMSTLVGPGYLPANAFTDHVVDIALLGAGLSWSFTLTSQLKVREATQRQLLEIKVRERTRALEEAVEAVRTLRGLVPICSCCKKIRNDDGFWEQVETYLSEHTEADFSHGLCPECAESNYPAYFPRKREDSGDG